MSNIKNVITINDFNYSQGGASKVAIDTANMLSERGYNSIFISAVCNDEKCTLNPNVVQYKYCGKEFLNCSNKIKGMLDGLKCKKFSKFVETVISNYSPNDTIVHVHGWTKACSSDFFNVIRRKGFKTYLTLHEYFSFCANGGYYNYNKRRACNKKACSIDCLFCNCDSRNYIIKLYRFVRELIYKKDIDFKHVYAVFVSEFEKRIITKQIELPNSAVIENPVEFIKYDEEKKYDFAFIGRTSKEKGIELFLDLARKRPDKQFLIVGDLNDVTSDNLSVTGWVSENEVDMYLAKSRVLVFPSLWPETFGLNVIKALMSGIPCLVSSNTAAADYIRDGENGFVFEQGNCRDLLNKSKDVLSVSGKNNDINVSEYIEKIVKIYSVEVYD